MAGGLAGPLVFFLAGCFMTDNEALVALVAELARVRQLLCMVVWVGGFLSGLVVCIGVIRFMGSSITAVVPKSGRGVS